MIFGESLKWMFWRKKTPRSISIDDDGEELGLLIEDEAAPSTVTGGSATNKSPKKSNGESGHKVVENAVSSKSKEKGDDDAAAEEYELAIPQWMESVSVFRVFVEYYISNRAFYGALFQCGLCLGVLYLADGPRHFVVSPSLKQYDRDFFIFLHLIFLLISYLTFGRNEAKDSDQILSRLQTEEWKGIMQIGFVMYHYFDAAEVYNLIRVFIGAYIWSVFLALILCGTAMKCQWFVHLASNFEMFLKMLLDFASSLRSCWDMLDLLTC